MKLLFTGSNGFLGKSILSTLNKQYEVLTLDISNADFICNLSKNIPSLPEIDIVVHAAGKAHVIPKSKKEIDEFFQINLQGTINLCSAIEKNKLPKAFVFISTVAVYGLDSGINITEDSKLIGMTPYADSKIQAENYLQKWCSENQVTLGILRPSLIAGRKPKGNLGAMINSIKNGSYFRIGDGESKKSILMVEDIARIIPKLSSIGGVFNVCDDYHPSFAELEALIAEQLDQKVPKSIPFWTAKILAIIGDFLGRRFPINSDKLNKIVTSLTFSNEKAKRELGWKPLDVIENFKIK